MENIKIHNGFISILAKFMNWHLIKISARPRTKKNYQVFFNNMVGYIGIKSELTIDEIDLQFIMEYKDYLSDYIKTFTHVSRNVEFIKATLEYCVDELEILPKNPLRKYKAVRDEVGEIVYLTKDELKKYAKYKGKHEIEKDMFLLQCYTGMSYGDLWSYEITTDKDGDWIYNKRNKNQKKYWIPLEKEGKKICLRYNLRFPYVRNLEYNDIIREVAKATGINKHLTSHDGRRTFATQMFNDGWSEESISLMMGITMYTLNKYYLNKSKLRISTERNERLKRMAV